MRVRDVFASGLAGIVGPVLRDTRGVAAVFMALGMIPLLGISGLAVDASLGYLLKSRMSKSLDTAGLSAGRVALQANAEDVARAYFDANFGTGGGDVTIEDFDFQLDVTNKFVTLSARASTPTRFMRIFGQDTMTVGARTVIERETTGMELALVMDNTGSLWGSASTNLSGTPFEALQNAADDLVDILFGSEETIDNLWVSLVPYTASVNIGPSNSSWLSATDRVFTDPSAYRPDLTGGGWKGCVMARAYPQDTTDSTPATNAFTSFLYPKTSTDNNWPSINDDYTASNKNRRGPNLGCGTPIMPLTASKTTLKAGIAAMKPWRRGGTTGNLGLVWGWRTISPNWRGLWGDPALPLDYDTDFMEKAVVMLTDGNNEFYNLPNGENGDSSTPSDYTGYGRVNDPGPVGLDKSTTAAGVGILNSRMTEICTAMKAQKIRIYTIIFGTSPNATTQALYQACATTPSMYFYAPDNSKLAAAFKAIGGELANLRIVE